MAPIITLFPSDIRSTSSSTAPSRNLSTSTGLSGVACVSSLKYLFSCLSLWTISIPLPPKTKDGLTNTGYPISSAFSVTSSEFVATAHFGIFILAFSIRSPHWPLSSAASISLTFVPRILVFNSLSLMYFSIFDAKLTAVCPPNCKIIPYGFSTSSISNIASPSNGSK